MSCRTADLFFWKFRSCNRSTNCICTWASLPARRIGLWDRGLVRPSFAADLVVFDPERITDTATFEDPKRYPEGIEMVVVNGKVVLEGGKRTRERPGVPLLHHSRP